MKQYRTALHRKPKPWRFRKARREAIRRTETRYRKKKRLKKREHRIWWAEEMRGRPQLKSLRDSWEADYVDRWEAWRQKTFRAGKREAAQPNQT